MKRKGFKTWPLTYVEWYDHSGDAGWVDNLDELDEAPITCKTVGFKVKETETSIHVMSTLTDDGGQGGNNEILKSCIIKEKVLRKKL